MTEIQNPKVPEASNLAMLRRLFAEHGRRHLPKYALALLLMAVSAGATSTTAYLLKPVVNGMVDASGFKQLRMLSWAVAGLFLIRGLVTCLLYTSRCV